MWARGPAADFAGLLIGGRPRPSAAMPLAVILLMLARGLVGGRRLAHRVLVAVVVAGMLAPVLIGSGRAGAVGDRAGRWVAGGARLARLVAVRDALPVRPHPRRRRAAARLGLLGLVVVGARGGWLVGVEGDSPARSARLALAAAGTGGMLSLLAILVLAVALAPVPAPAPGTA